MTIVTPAFALILLAAIMIGALLIAFTSPDFEKSKSKSFLACMSGLGVLITFMFYYSIVELQQQQQYLTFMAQTTSLSHHLNEEVMKGFDGATESVPYFISSLFPLTPPCIPPSDVGECDVKATTLKNMIAGRIFESWQTYILSTKFIIVDFTSYITLFLQYAHSQPLRTIWSTASPDTHAFPSSRS